MWYSLSNGGKRLRPIILAEVSKALGLKKNRYLNMMLATELIHCYSLVHDDLPSMDDDDYRRANYLHIKNLMRHRQYFLVMVS